MTCLSWAHPESGPLLVGGTDAGRLYVWEPPPASLDLEEARPEGSQAQQQQQPQWHTAASMQCSDKGIKCVWGVGPRVCVRGGMQCLVKGIKCVWGGGPRVCVRGGMQCCCALQAGWLGGCPYGVQGALKPYNP